MINDKIALEDWLKVATEKKMVLHDYLLEVNAEELECSKQEILEKMTQILVVMKEAIDFGLLGKPSHSGLTGGDAKKLRESRKEEKYCNLLGKTANDAIMYAIAVGECNAAMGRIVAAPTAGASGVLPGVLFALKENLELTDDELAKALVVAGNIGMVIANRASLSGAMGGCQAECGSAAAMAAGATVDILGGTPRQVGHAVAIVFKNMLGLVCDPVAGLVEVPCIKRNGGAAIQALLAAELALAGIESFIPADETIDAMKSVGDKLPCALKETAGGGIAQTPTALAWAKQYFSKK